MSELHGKVSREIQQHIFLIGLDRIDKRNAFDRDGSVNLNNSYK